MNIRTLTLAAVFIIGVQGALAVAPTYDGRNHEGWVWVPESYGTHMSGTYNVRFNPRTGHETSWIIAYYYIGGNAYFQAYDATRGNRFYCYVPSSDYYYDDVIQLIGDLGDGASLSVQKRSDSWRCRTNLIDVEKASDRQH